MQVKVIRKRSQSSMIHSDPEWETINNMVLNHNELPRQGDHMQLMFSSGTHSYVVLHLVWHYKGSSLVSAEIVVQ